MSNVRPHKPSAMKDDPLTPPPPPKWARVVHLLGAAEFHWHFAEGLKCLGSGQFIAGVLTLLTGIEASIRFTLHRLNADVFPFEGDLGPVL